VEWLRLVETVSVRGTVHVSVQILLGRPVGAVPKLSVTSVTASKGVGALRDDELGGVLEKGSVTASEVGLVVCLGAQVRGTGSGGAVVLGLVVSGSVEHGAGSEATRSDLHGDIILRDHLSGVESTEQQSETVNRQKSYFMIILTLASQLFFHSSDDG